jgi:hypothetical protein
MPKKVFRAYCLTCRGFYIHRSNNRCSICGGLRDRSIEFVEYGPEVERDDPREQCGRSDARAAG